MAIAKRGSYHGLLDRSALRGGRHAGSRRPVSAVRAKEINRGRRRSERTRRCFATALQNTRASKRSFIGSVKTRVAAVIARPSPEAPIYHGVEREPRTRVPALPQLPAVRPDCAARLTWPRRGDRETRTRVPAASHSGDGNGLIDCLRVHEEIGP